MGKLIITPEILALQAELRALEAAKGPFWLCGVLPNAYVDSD
jgi:hypothetical protein